MKLRSLKCLVAKVVRIVELCFLLLLLYWISTRLPFAVKISGEYFRQLVGVMVKPLILFVLYNFIVLTLLFMPGLRLFGGASAVRGFSETELYSSFLEDAEFSSDFSSEIDFLAPAEVVYEDKQMIVEQSTVTGSEETETVTNKALEAKVLLITQSEKLKKERVEEMSLKLRRSETEKCRKVASAGKLSPEKCGKVANADELSPETAFEPKVPRRTQSEKLKNANMEEISMKLRRSETEKCREVANAGDVAHKVDELSNEEFQKTIEEFIAKQIKFHKKEQKAIVLHSQA